MKGGNSAWWRRLGELDADQKRAFQLGIEGNYLIVGPPGSGKTNVLVLRAQYVSSTGRSNVRLLVYTKVLREFIATGCGVDLNFPAGQVQTFASWASTFIRERGLELPDDIKDSLEPEARQTRLALLEKAVAGLGHNYYDSLIIDEVQDLWPTELRAVSKLTSRLFMAGDSRQRIYGEVDGLPTALELAGGAKNQIVLEHHYRIGPAICEVADRLRVDAGETRLSATQHYQDPQFPSRVDPHHEVDFESQCRAAVPIIATQLRSYPGDWIGIIVQKRILRQTVFDILESSELKGRSKMLGSDQRDSSFDSDRPICIVTLQGSKGLEFRAVHWMGADKIPYYAREKPFTAITRAKTAVDIYYSGTLHADVRAALTPIKAPGKVLPE